MGDGFRERLGRLRVGGRGSTPTTDAAGAAAALAPGEGLASLAARLDIGAAQFVAGPRLAYDIDTADLPALFAAAAQHAAERDLAAYVQLPGRCLPLTADLVAQRADDSSSHPRCRLLLGGPLVGLAENLAIERWKQAARAYRSLSDDHPVRLRVPGSPAPQRGPARTEDAFDEPVDMVYTWVDSQDPGWRRMAAPYLDLEDLEDDLYTPGDELRYSLRSVDVFAPWVRRVHVLSNCAPPDWFVPSERHRWVDHSEVAEPTLLPTFNSGAIDTLLHRIPDLAEHFLYLNDDFVLWDSVTPATFYAPEGRTVAHLAMNSSVLYLQQLVEAGRAAPSQHSRVNAARLLEDRVGVFQSRVHGHVPYALRRSRLRALEEEFPAEIAATRASRTRQPTDVSFIAYLYHHLGHARGEVDYRPAPSSFVTLQNYQRSGARQALRSAPFVCFQDSRGSASDSDYAAFRRSTLEAALPLRSSAEGPG
jgi:hypothetical protein